MHLDRAKRAWFRANWQGMVGIPLPDSGEWRLSQTPLTYEILKNIDGKRPRHLAFVQTVERNRRVESRFQSQTQQHVYRTHDCLLAYADEVDACPGEWVFEVFSARPEANVFVLDVFPSRSNVVDVVTELEDKFDLDIQVVGVGPEEPVDYPGRFVDMDRFWERRILVKALPAVNHVSIAGGVQEPELAREIVQYGKITKESLLPGSPEGIRRAILTGLGIDTVPARHAPTRERPEFPGQTTLHHYDPGTLVDDEVTMEPDDEGNVSVAQLAD